MLRSPWNFDFSGTAYHRDLKPVPLDLACFDPYLWATQAILMHFSQSKSTKCEILAVCLTPPDQKIKKKSIWTGKSVQKGLKIWAVTKIMNTYSPECTVSKPVPLESACPKIQMHGVSSHFEHFFLVKTEFIFSIAFPIWKSYLFLKNTQIFWPGRTAQNHLKVTAYQFFGHANHSGGG